jgi:hypothetical protein
MANIALHFLWFQGGIFYWPVLKGFSLLFPAIAGSWIPERWGL